MSNQLKETAKEPLLTVKNLRKHYPVPSFMGTKKEVVKAVDDVCFEIYKGETYGLVGESGCGKSTMGRTLLRLIDPTNGSAYFDEQDIFKLKGQGLRKARKNIQMIFQDPHSSLDPRKKIGYSIEESLKIHGIGTKAERKSLAMTQLLKMGFSEEHYYKYPHEFSGGQRQRIGIARALVLQPKLIICDEPVSALDVSIQAQIINLLKSLQKELQISYLFIAHDLSVVRHIADRTGVMYLGNLVEQGNTEELFDNPLHPYTKSLLAAVPTIKQNVNKERIVLEGEIPSPLNPPSGCVFHPRCPFASERCAREVPKRIQVDAERMVQCHLYD